MCYVVSFREGLEFVLRSTRVTSFATSAPPIYQWIHSKFDFLNKYRDTYSHSYWLVECRILPSIHQLIKWKNSEINWLEFKTTTIIVSRLLRQDICWSCSILKLNQPTLLSTFLFRKQIELHLWTQKVQSFASIIAAAKTTYT